MGAKINNKAFSFVLPDNLLTRLNTQSKAKRISKACYVRYAVIELIERDELKQTKQEKQ